jgi:hypothetical protein
VYAGNDRFYSTRFDPQRLKNYSWVLLPAADRLTGEQLDAMREIQRSGRTLVAFKPCDPALAQIGGLQSVPDLYEMSWQGKGRLSSQRLTASLVGLEPAVRLGSEMEILATAYFRERLPGYILHFVNQVYDAKKDSVRRRASVLVDARRPDGFDVSWRLHFLAPGHAASTLEYETVGSRLRFRLPLLEVYAVAAFGRKLPGVS